MKSCILRIILPSGKVKKAELNAKDHAIYTIGRNGDISLNDPYISSIHGQFVFDENQLYYCDNHSTNGSTVIRNGHKKYLHNSDEYIRLNEQTFISIAEKDAPPIVILISQDHKNWNYLNVDEYDKIYIGRDSHCEIQLNHPSVSRRQALITHTDHDVYIADFNSLNGVFLNGEKINDRVPIQGNDIIQILGYNLIYINRCVYYQKEAQGVDLVAEDIVKVVDKNKVLLDHISLKIDSNDFVAIVGGSGAGKTTLFNAISGFDPKCSGHVFFNGIDVREHFNDLKGIIGYVPQEDIVYENLTLRKMLRYTAELKAMPDVSKAEREKQIDYVLRLVDLTEHQNTYIRKLSGGQKKRASIAVELLGNPKLFFLDEPTSGLDPGNEYNLMKSLHALAKQEDKTVLIVTHTVQNIDLCDKIVFLGAGGKLCFYGNIDEARKFFEEDDISNIYNIIAERPDYWQNKYLSLRQRKKRETTTHAKMSIVKSNISGFKQFRILLRRNLELFINDRSRLFLTLLQPIVIGICLYLVAEKDIFKVYEPTKSMMFSLSCAAIWMGLFDSIQEICKERHILKREYMSGVRIRSYLGAKFVLLFLVGLVQTLIMVILFLSAIGTFKKGIFLDNFTLEILLTTLLTVLSSTAMGLLVSSIAKSGDKAMTAAPFILIVQLLFSGILFDLKGITQYISYITVSRWSVEALGTITHLNKLTMKLQKNPRLKPLIPHEKEALYKISKMHVLQDWGILLLICIICIIASGVMLRRLKNDSR